MIIIIIIIINRYLEIIRSFTFANEDLTHYHKGSRSDFLFNYKILHPLVLLTVLEDTTGIVRTETVLTNRNKTKG